MQEGGAAERSGIGERLSSLGGIENELHLAVFDGIDNMRAAFELLVDPRRFDAVCAEVALCSRRCDDLESKLASSFTAASTRGLSASRTETKTVPARGSRAPPPIWLFAKAASKERSMPITSPVERISGPSTVSTPGKRANGNTASLTPTWRGAGTSRLKLFERLPNHHPRSDLRHRDPDHLGNEGHGARCARIDFKHIDVTVLDRILNVHQPDHLERKRQRAALALKFGNRRCARANRAAVRRPNPLNGCRPPQCAP